jgi:hypothetical protein
VRYSDQLWSFFYSINGYRVDLVFILMGQGIERKIVMKYRREYRLHRVNVDGSKEDEGIIV